MIKADRFLVDRQNNAPSVAGDTVGVSGRVDHECASFGRPILVTLGPMEHQDVLVAGVIVNRDLPRLAETNEGGAGSDLAIAVKAVDIDAVVESLPGNLVLAYCNVKQVVKLDALIRFR